ncbi:MAG: TIGR03943 family protein [Cyanobacteria bacterium J06639_14]
MFPKFPLLQNLTQRILGQPDRTDEPAIDIWVYAEPAGEEPNPLQRNVLQWRRLITSVREPVEEFPGQPVDIIGFVHRPFPPIPNQFVLARRIIRCCLADTVPLGLAIATETANIYEADQWLRVQGTFGTTEYRHRPTLVVIPETITAIEEPQKAYINGVF